MSLAFMVISDLFKDGKRTKWNAYTSVYVADFN